MYHLNATKKTILLTLFCFTVVISMSNKFSLEPSYSQDIINNSPDNEVFNIAIAGDWGCTEDTEKTAENIQKKNPELVIGSGDYSYTGSAECWFDIIKPFKSKMKIAMGDHEYSDTSGGEKGIINQYLKPLNLEKTYYSFNMNNVHVTIIDPYIDYEPDSAQYQFIEQDLKTAFINPKIDWTFVVESIPIYTSPSDHPADSKIRDIYHPLFDKYGVDLVFSSDNHNYQRTFPLKYNSEDDSSNNPIVSYSNQNNYYNTNEYNSEDDSSNNPIVSYSNQNNYYNTNDGVIYLIIGTAGRSLYDIEEQAPFVSKQYDEQFGFLNIDIYPNNVLRGTFYANEDDDPQYYSVSTTNNNMIDRFIISNMKSHEQ